MLDVLAPAVDPPTVNDFVAPPDELAPVEFCEPPVEFEPPRPPLPAELDPLLLLPEHAATVSPMPADNRA